jgi:hypothetical protein
MPRGDYRTLSQPEADTEPTALAIIVFTSASVKTQVINQRWPHAGTSGRGSTRRRISRLFGDNNCCLLDTSRGGTSDRPFFSLSSSTSSTHLYSPHAGPETFSALSLSRTTEPENENADSTRPRFATDRQHGSTPLPAFPIALKSGHRSLDDLQTFIVNCFLTVRLHTLETTSCSCFALPHRLSNRSCLVCKTKEKPANSPRQSHLLGERLQQPWLPENLLVATPLVRLTDNLLPRVLICENIFH